MNIDKFKIFCIYSENEEGTLDELVVDTYNEDYAFTRNTDEEELACRHDPEIKGFRVSRDFFDYYFNLLVSVWLVSVWRGTQVASRLHDYRRPR